MVRTFLTRKFNESMPAAEMSGIERTYVMREVADRFIDGVVRKASALEVGDPLAWRTAIGPMVSKDQYDLVCELVDDAIASGAKRLCGGPVEVEGFNGNFIAPTVLTDVTHDMRIMLLTKAERVVDLRRHQHATT